MINSVSRRFLVRFQVDPASPPVPPATAATPKMSSPATLAPAVNTPNPTKAPAAKDSLAPVMTIFFVFFLCSFFLAKYMECNSRCSEFKTRQRPQQTVNLFEALGSKIKQN